MPKLMYALIAALWALFAPPAIAQSPTAGSVPDSKKIEQELQALPWKKFRSVIESVPKLKADVDAYGPAGWKYVEASYRTHGWKKSIDKLDDEQKQRIVELIRIAKGAG